MTAQSGVFTIHSKWERDLRQLQDNDYQERDCDIESGSCFVVPAAAKGAILRLLDRLGISPMTLFPELGGTADGLVKSEVLRR
jgi:hypothetical protein